MLEAVSLSIVRLEGSLYYTARDGICLVLGRWGVSLTRPVLRSVWLYFGWGVYLTRTVMASVSSFGCWGLFVVEKLLGRGEGSLTRLVL